MYTNLFRWILIHLEKGKLNMKKISNSLFNAAKIEIVSVVDDIIVTSFNPFPGEWDELDEDSEEDY